MIERMFQSNFVTNDSRIFLKDWERIWLISKGINNQSSLWIKLSEDTVRKFFKPWTSEINNLLYNVNKEFNFHPSSIESWCVSIKYKDVEFPNTSRELPFGIIDHEDGITEIIIDSLKHCEPSVNNSVNWCGT